MLLAFSFNLATLFKQSISSGSTSNVLSLSFHPINFTIFIWSVVMYIYGPNKAYHSSNDNSKWLLTEIWRDSIHSICNNKVFFFIIHDGTFHGGSGVIQFYYLLSLASFTCLLYILNTLQFFPSLRREMLFVQLIQQYVTIFYCVYFSSAHHVSK